MRTIIFITGAARSGKSTLAKQIVLGSNNQFVKLSDFLGQFSRPFNSDCDWIIFDEEINEMRHIKVLNGVLVQDEINFEMMYSSKKCIAKIPNVIVVTEKFDSKLFDCRKFSHVIDITCKTK